MYATIEDYREVYNNIENDKDITKGLKLASHQIDSLTFNRIGGEEGYNNLTPFQQKIIKEVCIELVNFNYENKETLNSIYSSYSINGVNMTIGNNPNIKNINDINIPSSIYNLLKQTGLCVRIL